LCSRGPSAVGRGPSSFELRLIPQPRRWNGPALPSISHNHGRPPRSLSLPPWFPGPEKVSLWEARWNWPARRWQGYRERGRYVLALRAPSSTFANHPASLSESAKLQRPRSLLTMTPTSGRLRHASAPAKPAPAPSPRLGGRSRPLVRSRARQHSSLNVACVPFSAGILRPGRVFPKDLLHTGGRPRVPACLVPSGFRGRVRGSGPNADRVRLGLSGKSPLLAVISVKGAVSCSPPGAPTPNHPSTWLAPSSPLRPGAAGVRLSKSHLSCTASCRPLYVDVKPTSSMGRAAMRARVPTWPSLGRALVHSWSSPRLGLWLLVAAVNASEWARFLQGPRRRSGGYPFGRPPVGRPL